MGALEQVMQLKQQGIPESDIAMYLRDQGIPPKEITEALSQSKIKSELNREEIYAQEQAQEGNYPSEMQSQNEYSMQPSIMLKDQPEEIQQIPSSYEPVTQQQQYPDYQYSQQNYPESSQEYQQTNIETMNEIAEQLIEEKNEKIQKQISILTAFKEEISDEIEKISQRLEKIENNFNNLQSAIIRKIGDYGEDIKNIAKEMHATQESFSKIINPLTDNARKHPQASSETEPEQKSRRAKKSGQFSDSKESEPATKFEDYLR